MAELVELIDAFDRVVAAAAEVLPSERVVAAGAVARRARNRRGYLGRSVVVALAGGTGSGKSSLLNAIAAEEVAVTGPQRPTTDRPLAWVPADPEPGVIRLLDDLGIPDRVGQMVADWLVVIDLPDTDSVAFPHREMVARLLPEVDVVVWVLDPEKYQDRILHHDHLGPLADYADQFLFVLNQTDRLDPDDVAPVVDDLRRSLAADGIAEAVIVPTAADPMVGGPAGIDDLMLALRSLGEAKSVVHRKLLTDLEREVSDLAAAAGLTVGGGTGFTAGWEAALREASAAVAGDVLGDATVARAGRRGASSGRVAASLLRSRRHAPELDLTAAVGGRRPGTLRAVTRLDGFVGDLARGLEGEVAGEVRRVGADVDEAVRAAVDTIAYGETVTLPGPPAWAPAIAWVRRLGLVALVAGVAWGAPRRGADLPAAVALVGLLLMLIPLVVVAGVSARAARRAVLDHRSGVERAVSRELDRTLGRPLRDVLRKRAAMSASLVEFDLVRRKVVPTG